MVHFQAYLKRYNEENVLQVNEFAYNGVQKLGQSLDNIKNGAVTGHGFLRIFD